jgi:hypothetical protein
VVPTPPEMTRALEGQAVKARLAAEKSRDKLRSQPFWRLRRRRVIGRELALARRREEEALRLLSLAEGKRG